MFENNPFATHTLEILIMLLGAFLIGLWLGWVLWGRLKEEMDRMRVDNQSLNVTLDAMRLEIESIKTRAVVAESDNSNYTTQVVNLNRENASLRDKISFLESELANTQDRNLKVETELGLSFAPDTPIADDIPLEVKSLVFETPEPVPTPEPEPAQEPATEPVNEPQSVSIEINLEPEMTTPPVLILEPTPMAEPEPQKPVRQKSTEPKESDPAPAATSSDRDDLTVVEGIGPKIQMLLNQYGIYTYRHLAEADVLRLKEILSAAGPQLAMHDPGTWPSQANLAANDQWDTLKSVQGFLKGGKKPD